MRRPRKGWKKSEQIRVEGTEASIYWENQSRLENAEEKLWDAHSELAGHLRTAIEEVLCAHGKELASAVEEYNAALDDIAVQHDEFANGPQGEGSDDARDNFAGIGENLFERRALLSPISVVVDEIEFNAQGRLQNPPVELTVSIPRFGDARVERNTISRRERDTAWQVLAHLPLAVGPGRY